MTNPAAVIVLVVGVCFPVLVACSGGDEDPFAGPRSFADARTEYQSLMEAGKTDAAYDVKAEYEAAAPAPEADGLNKYCNDCVTNGGCRLNGCTGKYCNWDVPGEKCCKNEKGKKCKR